MSDLGEAFPIHSPAGLSGGNTPGQEGGLLGRLALDDQAATNALRREDSPSAWYCVHSRPKHEHIAASHLRQLEDVEVFGPRLRFLRSTRQGPVWVTEAAT